ncbi:MAG: hypothetical protein GXP62_07150 [Oligoflexia bacterium]|nr:hypothetical protein [Oligoflexia bacterium]
MSTVLLALALVLGCGSKKAPPVAAAAPAQPVATPAAPPAPEPEPAAPEPAPEVNNADLTVTLKFADGTTKTGHVKRIERSVDFYAEAGWLTDEKKLMIEGETGTVLHNIPWTKVRSVSVIPGKVPADVSCSYTTDFTPWMYDCTLKTSGKLVDTDNKSWTVSNRHKWRFTFDDDSQVEFWLYKFAARQQDTTVVDMETVNPENLSIYQQLQEKLRSEAKSGDFVTSVSVQ